MKFEINCQIFRDIVKFEINCQIFEKFVEFFGKLSNFRKNCGTCEKNLTIKILFLCEMMQIRESFRI